jgi:hypothetical protein
MPRDADAARPMNIQTLYREAPSSIAPSNWFFGGPVRPELPVHPLMLRLFTEFLFENQQKIKGT